MTEAVLYDAETGLPGRALLLDRLRMALRGAERTGHEVGLVLVHIEAVEDPEGPVGAADMAGVLKEVGERLSSCVRGVDSVGRLGPTTFALVLQGEVGEEGLGVLARRVLFELSPPVVSRLRQFFVLARLGGTVARARVDDPGTMLRRARQALATAQEPDGELFVLHLP